MLNFKIKKLDDVNKELQGLYKEVDGEFQLQVSGLEDTSELKSAYERVKADRNTLRDQLKTEKDKFEEADNQLRAALSSNNNNDEKIESLKSSYEQKIERIAKEKDEQILGLTSHIESQVIDITSSEISSEIALDGSAKVLDPHVRRRLSVEKTGDKYVPVVLDASGKVSALTIDDLKNEFSSDPLFSHVIRGTRATGGDASSTNKGGDAAKQVSRSKWNSMSPSDQGNFIEKGGEVIND